MFNKELSPVTKLAITQFNQIKWLEKEIEQDTLKLNGLVSQIPADEMDAYVKETSK